MDRLPVGLHVYVINPNSLFYHMRGVIYQNHSEIAWCKVLLTNGTYVHFRHGELIPIISREQFLHDTRRRWERYTGINLQDTHED